MCPWVDKKALSFWFKLFMVMNLPFYMRWQLANMIVSGLSHSALNGQPRNFNTHHRASAEDLLVGWEIGFNVLIDGVDVTVRVMMACVIGDGPGRSRARVSAMNMAHLCSYGPRAESLWRNVLGWMPVL